jgi:hypothetical protein
LTIAQGYITNHEAEADRGWDARELLRGMVASVRRIGSNVRQVKVDGSCRQ